MMPKISVIALCYNHSEYVISTLESILLQSDNEIEVLVIDDSSTDDSFEKISNWILEKQLDWRYLRNNINQGISKTLNAAVQDVQCDYVKFIACDDILMPTAIADLVSCFEKQPDECGMVFGDMEVINEFGKTISNSYLADTDFLPEILDDSLFFQLSKKCFVPAPSSMIRRSVFDTIQFNENLLFEDWDFWLQLSKTYRFVFVDKLIVKYRRLQNSLFHSLTSDFRYSLMKMAYQNLNFDKRADYNFKKVIVENAMIYYIHNGPHASLWLLRRFKYTLNLRHLYHYIKSLLLH